LSPVLFTFYLARYMNEENDIDKNEHSYTARNVASEEILQQSLLDSRKIKQKVNFDIQFADDLSFINST
jgi:hypothetical protein